MPKFVYQLVDFDPVIRVNVPDTDGPRTGLYEAWLISTSAPLHSFSIIEKLRSVLSEPLMLALSHVDCAHVDSHYQTVNPYLTSLSKEELHERFGEIPEGYEVNRLVFHITDGREQGLKH